MKKKLDKLIQDYNENGFVKLGQIVSKEYSKKLTERALNLMSGKKRYKGMFFQLEGENGKYENININSDEFVGPSKNYRKIKDLEYDNLFLRVIKNKYLRFFSNYYIGKEVSCMRAMILNKPAKHSSKLNFHQDVSDNWNMSGKPNFTFWMSLNGASKKKGCLKIIEKSHVHGKIGNGHFLTRNNKSKFKKSKVKYIELKSGEGIIFNNFLLHGSDQNKTSRMRLAFTVCLMNSKIKHKKYSKRYPKVFGKGAITYQTIKNLSEIPKKPYVN